MRKIAVLPSLLDTGCAGWGFAPANDQIVAQFTIHPGGIRGAVLDVGGAPGTPAG